MIASCGPSPLVPFSPGALLPADGVNDFDAEDEHGREMGRLIANLLSRGTLPIVLSLAVPRFAPGAARKRKSASTKVRSGDGGVVLVGNGSVIIGDGGKASEAASRRRAWKETAERKHTAAATRLGVPRISMAVSLGLLPADFLHESKPPPVELQRVGGVAAQAERWAIHPCTFACSHHTDLIHANGCGHRLIAKIVAVALRSLLTIDASHPPTASALFPEFPPLQQLPSAETRLCVRMNLPSEGDSSSGAVHYLPSAGPPGAHLQVAPALCRADARDVAAVERCYSNVGPRSRWNLWPAGLRGGGRYVRGGGTSGITSGITSEGRSGSGADDGLTDPASGWRLVDLAKHQQYQSTNSGRRQFKFLWEGRRPGSTIRFRIDCPRAGGGSDVNNGMLRLMVLQTATQGYGSALLSIDGIPIANISGRSAKGSLFVDQDMRLPSPPSSLHHANVVSESRAESRAGGRRVPGLGAARRLDVELTVLPSPDGGGVGFGLNTIICT